MLSLLTIKNVALIDEMSIEFGRGLNLLTGETGSGKSIIVDSLGTLRGERVTSDIIKQGEDTAVVEGEFTFDTANAELSDVLNAAGIESEGSIIVRREISASGKNRVFVNGRLLPLSTLRSIGVHLVDIFGQGEHSSVYDVATHKTILDGTAGLDRELERTSKSFAQWNSIRTELADLRKDESERLQLIDVLRFQADEIETAAIESGEDDRLEEEKRRLANAEKLDQLTDEVHGLLYDSDDSTLSTLERAVRRVDELREFDSSLDEFTDGIASARATIDELANAIREMRGKLEFSPGRLDEIEGRLVEIGRLKRKYGGTIESVLDHLTTSRNRLSNIESSDLRESELSKQLVTAEADYVKDAEKLHDARKRAAVKLASRVETLLKDVALEKARFDIRVEKGDVSAFAADGYDNVEFYFSANPGEQLRPLARIASGGEASRVMLVLTTAVRSLEPGKTAVYDEVDVGIGGRVAEAVGRKLKDLAASQQILCVTHQPQIASLADHHFVVEKSTRGNKTRVSLAQLDDRQKVEEIARMLAGETITDAARQNAMEMLATGAR